MTRARRGGTPARWARLLGAAALPVLLAACSSIGAIFGDNDDASYADLNASQVEVEQTASEIAPVIASQCPSVFLREGAQFHRAYAPGGRIDAQALRYQGVLDRLTRECVVSNGLITVRIEAFGRVIVGPAGGDGTATVPLRFTAQRDGMAVFSERYQVPVAVSRSDTNTFSHTVEDIAIPFVGGETIVLWVGFDQ